MDFSSYERLIITKYVGAQIEYPKMAISILSYWYLVLFFPKVFWHFGLIFSPLEVRDGSQIVDLVEIYRSNFLFFIFEPWTSCLRPKYDLEFSGYLLLPPPEQDSRGSLSRVLNH